MKICRHFGECGGCRFQDIPYKEQLLTKEKRVKELSLSFGFDVEIKPINHSEPFYYRNKMEFSFSKANDGKIICGFYKRESRNQLIDLEECLIFSPDAGKILAAVKKFVNKEKYSPYNKYSHKGFLRNLIVRETKFTNELMIALVTSGQEHLKREDLVKKLCSLKLNSELKSIYWIVNDSLSDAVIFDKKELLFGQEHIKERLNNLEFLIGVDTFFQVNPKAVISLYNKIRDYASLSGSEKVLDIFCGVGSIGLFLAKQAKFVWGVEAVGEIVELAHQNAKRNNIDNISFCTSDARKFLNTQGIFYKDIDVLVINPPRSGLSKKIVRAILRLGPKTIIYSSCNPQAFFRDLEGLGSQYSFDFIEPFDFFPHTPHLEVLSVLRKSQD